MQTKTNTFDFFCWKSYFACSLYDALWALCATPCCFNIFRPRRLKFFYFMQLYFLIKIKCSKPQKERPTHFSKTLLLQEVVQQQTCRLEGKNVAQLHENKTCLKSLNCVALKSLHRLHSLRLLSWGMSKSSLDIFNWFIFLAWSLFLMTCWQMITERTKTVLEWRLNLGFSSKTVYILSV